MAFSVTSFEWSDFCRWDFLKWEMAVTVQSSLLDSLNNQLANTHLASRAGLMMYQVMTLAQEAYIWGGKANS